VDTTTSTEPLNIPNVKDTPGVAVPKPKKSKRASSRGLTKRGSIVDDDIFNSTKPSIDNDGSDNVVEPTYIPQEPRDNATNVTTDAAVQSIPQDEVFDYDEISVQSLQDNEPPTATSV